VKFQLLGPVRVWRGDAALPVGPAKQRSLVAALLLEPNRVVPLERLIGVIWDGEPPASAVANVRTYASRLRRTLADESGAARLSGHVPGYRLAVADDELDVTAFRRLAAEGRHALAAGDAGRAAGLLGRAVALWKGAAGEDLYARGYGQRPAARQAAIEERVARLERIVEKLLRGRAAGVPNG